MIGRLRKANAALKICRKFCANFGRSADRESISRSVRISCSNRPGIMLHHRLRALAIVSLAIGYLLTGCKPRLDSPDALERRRAVANASDPAILAGMAQKDPAEEVRVAAVQRISDQALLAEIVLAEHAEPVITAALARLTDPTLLAKIATTKHDDLPVEITAAGRITDQEVLRKLVTSDCEEAVRMSVFQQITDQKTLAQIAINAPAEAVRLAAIERLADPKLLIDVALSGHDYAIQRSAIERISDQDQIVRLAIKTADAGVVDSAVGKLTDPARLIRVAVEARIFQFPATDDASVGMGIAARAALLERLSDQTGLATVVIESPSEDLATAAREKLTDPAALARVEASEKRRHEIEAMIDQAALAALATQEGNLNFRLAAVAKLTGQDVLATIATTANGAIIRAAAVARLSEQPVLDRIVKEEGEAPVRLAAVGRVSDATVLAKVAREDGESSVRLAAVNAMAAARAGDAALREVLAHEREQAVRLAALRGINGQKDLVEIATADADAVVRAAAAERVTDQSALGKIATQDRDPTVRIAAVEKLDDEAVLGRVAAGDQAEAVRLAAIRRVKDQGVLRKAALADPSEDVREAAVASVTDQEVLRKAALEDKSWHVRSMAVGQIKDSAVVARIALEDESRIVRGAALVAMDHFGQTLLPLMQEALLTGQQTAKANACDALVHFGRAALPGLRAVLDSPAALTRRFAAEALGRLDDRPSAQALAAHLADGDDGVRRYSADAVAKFGEAGVAQVLPLLPAADGTVRRYILFILARAGGLREAAPVEALLTGDRETRWYAAHLLLTTSAPLDPAVGSIRKLIEEQKYAEAVAAGPAAVVLCSAKLADWHEGPAVAEVLAKAGWTPASDCERILYGMARRARGELTKDWPATERIILEQVQLGDDAMVENSVYSAIGCGVTSSVPELERILFASGSKEMAETYLNCGQGTLEEAARLWAADHGYSILPMGGSSPVTWGGL